MDANTALVHGDDSATTELDVVSRDNRIEQVYQESRIGALVAEVEQRRGTGLQHREEGREVLIPREDGGLDALCEAGDLEIRRCRRKECIGAFNVMPECAQAIDDGYRNIDVCDDLHAPSMASVRPEAAHAA